MASSLSCWHACSCKSASGIHIDTRGCTLAITPRWQTGSTLLYRGCAGWAFKTCLGMLWSMYSDSFLSKTGKHAHTHRHTNCSDTVPISSRAQLTSSYLPLAPLCTDLWQQRCAGLGTAYHDPGHCGLHSCWQTGPPPTSTKPCLCTAAPPMKAARCTSGSSAMRRSCSSCTAPAGTTYGDRQGSSIMHCMHFVAACSSGAFLRMSGLQAHIWQSAATLALEDLCCGTCRLQLPSLAASWLLHCQL